MGNSRYNRIDSRRSSRSGSKRTRNNLPHQAELEVGILIPDCHIPNHDVKAWGLMLRVAHFLKPKHLIILGDFADGETLSAHARTRPGAWDLMEEISAVNDCLDQLDILGAENKQYVFGNHEYRLDRYLMEHAPAMFNSLQWPAMLNLHKRGWKWTPYKKSTKVGKLHITHDTGSSGQNAHRSSAQRFGGSTVIGHTHRMSYDVFGRFEGSPYLACMLGWLGDADKAADYMHEVSAASTWVHGFGVFHQEPETGIVHVQPVPIVNGKCVVNGKLFSY